MCLATPWTVVHHPNPQIKPRSPTFQEDSLLSETPGKPKNAGVGGPIPSPGDLPDPGSKPGSPAMQADSLPAELPEKPIHVLRLFNI